MKLLFPINFDITVYSDDPKNKGIYGSYELNLESQLIVVRKFIEDTVIMYFFASTLNLHLKSS